MKRNDSMPNIPEIIAIDIPDVVDVCLEAIHKSLSKTEFADGLVQNVLQRAERDGDQRALGWGRCARGKIHFAKSNLMEAINDLKFALRIAKENGETRLEGFCCQFLGACYFERSEYAEAFEYSYQAVLVRRTLPNDFDLAHSLGGFGAVQAMLGNLRESADCLAEALEIARRHGNIVVQATLLSNMAVSFSDMGEENWPRALECFAESAQLARNLENHQLLVNCLTSWSSVLIKMNDWQGAESLVREAAEVAKHCAFVRSQLKARTALATLLLEQGRLEEALECLLAADTIAAADGQYDRYPLLPQTWGMYFWKYGERQTALSYLEKALQDSDRVGQKDISATIERQLSALNEELADFPNALRHFQSFYEKNLALEKQSAQNLLVAQKAKADVERARQEAELERLRNIELAEANRQKDLLLIQLRQQTDRLARQAIEDPLTGLYNRRYLMDYLDGALEQARTLNVPLSVMIADLDNFKKINDTFSHAIGDEVLKGTAQLLLANCRREDIVARFGGEEFVIVFPNMDSAYAVAVCERIRVAIESFPWAQFHPKLRVSVSMGVADEPEGRLERLLAIADKRLYRAKHGGKNRVIDWRTDHDEMLEVDPRLGGKPRTKVGN